MRYRVLFNITYSLARSSRCPVPVDLLWQRQRVVLAMLIVLGSGPTHLSSMCSQPQQFSANLSQPVYKESHCDKPSVPYWVGSLLYWEDPIGNLRFFTHHHIDAGAPLTACFFSWSQCCHLAQLSCLTILCVKSVKIWISPSVRFCSMVNMWFLPTVPECPD